MPTRSSVRGQQGRNAQLENPATENKENVKLNGSKAKARVKSRAGKVYCTCRKGDDGSPMILCAECNEWYVLVLCASKVITFNVNYQVPFPLNCIERERC